MSRPISTIVATFKVETFVITPTAGAHGTITPGTPQTVNYGGSATFTIAADTGYSIVDVLVDGVSAGAIASYTFSNVTANHTIAATFTQTFVITPTAGAGGTITPGTPQFVNSGGSATFAIAPNTGYSILDVMVDGVPQGAITSYTFSNVMANHTIAATFTTPDLHDHPSAGAGGTITPGTHADGELRRQRHLHDRGQHGLQDRGCAGGRGVEPGAITAATPSAT